MLEQLLQTDNENSTGTELARMREASGNYVSDDRLTIFLYVLARDHVTPGKMESILDSACGFEGGVTFTNGWLAKWAEDARDRLNARPS